MLPITLIWLPSGPPCLLLFNITGMYKHLFVPSSVTLPVNTVGSNSFFSDSSLLQALKVSSMVKNTATCFIVFGCLLSFVNTKNK
jgi:hypothetical protein